MRFLQSDDLYIVVLQDEKNNPIIMTRFVAVILLTILVCPYLSAKVGSDVSGRVLGHDGESIPYAYVAIRNDAGKVVQTGVTDDAGHFLFSGISEGVYRLAVSVFGYVPVDLSFTKSSATYDFGDIVLSQDQIEASVVVGEKSYLESKVDRFVYDVSSDPSASGLSAQQLLERLPFINVDRATGELTVMGGSDFEITINGKKSTLLSKSNQDYISRLLKGADLAKLELITSPDGEFVNNTAVLNIDTRSDLQDLVAGRVSLSGSTETSAGGNVSVTSKLGKLIYDISYDFKYKDAFDTEKNTIVLYESHPEFSSFESIEKSSPFSDLAHNVGARVSYDISSDDLLTLDFGADFGSSRNNVFSYGGYYSPSGVLSGSTERNTSELTERSDVRASATYRHSFPKHPGRMLSLRYSYDDKKSSYGSNAVFGSAKELSVNGLSNVEHAAFVDFYSPVNKYMNYYFTAKYVNRNYGSDVSCSDGQSVLSSLYLDYLQQIGSLEGNISLNFNKLMFNAQAAYEYVRTDADYNSLSSLHKNQNTLLLGLRMNWFISPQQSLMMNLTKSAFRPDINYLNPYEDRTVEGVVRTGNPDLENERMYSGLLMYSYNLGVKFSVNILGSLHWSDNGVYSYESILSDGTILKTYDNLGSSLISNMSMSISGRPSKWLSLMLMGRMGYYSFDYSGTSNIYWEPAVWFDANADLWKGANLNLSVWYLSPQSMIERNIQSSKRHYVFDGFLRLSQDIGNDWRVYLQTSNPWYRTHVLKTENISKDHISTQNLTMQGCTFSLGVTYNFGRFRDSVKMNSRMLNNTDRQKSL